MELNDLIFLGACSLYGKIDAPLDSRQYAAVQAAKEIWAEVLKQDKE